MRLGLADKCGTDPDSSLEIEAAVIYEEGVAQPLSGQFFYLLEKSAADIIPLVGKDYEKALEALRISAIKFIITDARGKAKISGLSAKTYFICGVSQAQKGFDVWNVQVELKPGKNTLRLDNNNMI